VTDNLSNLGKYATTDNHWQRLLRRICCCIADKQLRFVKSLRPVTWGPFWGPHVMRGDERSACLCTPRTAANWPHTCGDQRKRVTAIYWGSSGRNDSVDVGIGYDSSSEQSTKLLARADSASRLVLRSDASLPPEQNWR
jgi:hypothetical protein